MENPMPRRAAANPTQYNVDAIAKLEHDAHDRRTLTGQTGDRRDVLYSIPEMT
jgi:hypothetical protein